MNIHKIKNLAEPINSRDAVNKGYVDRRKPIITIWAQEKGHLRLRSCLFCEGRISVLKR